MHRRLAVQPEVHEPASSARASKDRASTSPRMAKLVAFIDATRARI